MILPGGGEEKWGDPGSVESLMGVCTPRARIRVLPEEWPSSDGDKTHGFDLFLDNLNVYPPRRLFLLLQM